MDNELTVQINEVEVRDAFGADCRNNRVPKGPTGCANSSSILSTRQLSGEENDLKGYNIGLDVFEKGSGFDPDSDTIVRVQMVRLRRMLEHYYLTTGKNDLVCIDIPKGRYVPRL